MLRGRWQKPAMRKHTEGHAGDEGLVSSEFWTEKTLRIRGPAFVFGGHREGKACSECLGRGTLAAIRSRSREYRIDAGELGEPYRAPGELVRS